MATTRVKARWVIELPKESKVKVKKGELVEGGDVVAVSETAVRIKADWSGWFGQLDEDQKGRLRQLLKGKKISVGERIDLTEARILGVKNIIAQIEGTIETIDEFGNLIVIEDGSQKRVEIRTPVGARVDVLSSDKIEMVFTAFKLLGQGLTSGRVWGLMDKTSFLTKITELTSKLEGRVMAVEKLDDLWLIKAAVVGVGAIVTQEWISEEEETVELEIPIIKIGKKEWRWLFEMAQNELNILVNSEMNRALVVKC